MKALFIFMFIAMSIIAGTTLAHAGKNPCSKIGKPKVKPHKFTKAEVKHYNAPSTVVLMPKFRSSYSAGL